jgi:hypothetical protein
MAIATAADYIGQVQRNVHDQTGATFTTAALLGMVNEARQRVALDTHCYRQFITGLNTITQQETYLYNGSLGGAAITAGGSGYVDPVVTISGGSGTGATATATQTAGIITSVNMTNWGSGYSSAAPPTFSITDSGGPGSGATASPIILNNVLDVLSIAVLWGDIRITFGYLPFTGFQTYCRAYANQYETPAIFTLHQGMLKAFLFPIPDQPYEMEMDVITQPTDLASTTSAETQIIAPWNDAVQWYASYLAIMSLQQFEKAKFFYDGGSGGAYGNRIKQLPATAFSRRIFNPYRTYWPMARRL